MRGVSKLFCCELVLPLLLLLLLLVMVLLVSLGVQRFDS